MKRYYLRIIDNEFGFRIEGENDILETDIQISNEDYEKFFIFRNQGKQFRLKDNSLGGGLFDYIEEHITVAGDIVPTDKERLLALEMAMLEVL